MTRRNSVASLLWIVCVACSARSVDMKARVGAEPGSQDAADQAESEAAAAAMVDAGEDASGYVLKTSESAKLGGVAGNGLRDGQCAERNIVTMRVVPTVWLVVDGSASMVESLGDSSRWSALRAALMDPDDGVVKMLEHDVHWGLVIYDGRNPLGFAQTLPDGGTPEFSAEAATDCPRLVSVEPKQDNYSDMDAAYAVSPLGGSTPTDQALRTVVGHLSGSADQVLDARVNPTIVVLATDGEPNDMCALDFADVRSRVVDVVGELANNAVKTYVISLAGDNQSLTEHLVQVAEVGMTGRPPFVPANKPELTQTFRDIIGPAAACEVVLNGSVKAGSECSGQLKINGVALPCNAADGWSLKDASTISITGEACEAYRNNQTAILEADFPCDAIELK